ncbi:hypothetical protein GW750_07160 [bacterium]|nr:hypothetical protein [bacterium]
MSGVFSLLQHGIEDERYTSIAICFNYFRNPISQIPVELQLMPLDKKTISQFLKQIGDIDLESYMTENLEKKDLMLEPSA